MLTLPELAERMRDLDFAMLTTRTEGGALSSRPMSNNGEVEYDGDSWFFAYDNARSIADIGRDPSVGLTLTGGKSLLGKPGIFIAIEGKATLIRDQAQFQAHWTKGLDRWFPDGTGTKGLILVKVHAARIHYWDGEDQGDLLVS